VRSLIFIAYAGFFFAYLGAQLPLPAKNTVETAHVMVSTGSAPAADTSAGSSATRTLFVDIAPKPKMHVYAPGEKEGIPVSLSIEPSTGVKAAQPQFPPPQKYFFAPLKLTQLVYSKPFRITQPVTLAGPLAGQTLTIKGTLRYQACDDTVCYLPKSVPLSWLVSQ
jgi:DsbC/DsbD-like thiol-disulfide interchange protein